MLAGTVPDWHPGDAILLGKRTLRVVGIRDDDADQPPALGLKTVSESGTSERLAYKRYSQKVRKGRVISQRPSVGRRLPRGTKVDVKISRGRRPPS